MSAKQYPFIDIAVHERVRDHFAKGDAAVLFSPDGARVLWSNGDGAALFGLPSIYDFLDAGPDRTSVTHRQLQATLKQLTAVGDRKGFVMRMTSGFRSITIAATVETILVRAGERAVLLTAPPLGKARTPQDAARRMIAGFDDPDTHMAVLDGEGGVLAASEGFAALDMTADTRRALVSAAARDRNWLVKRPVATGRGHLPAAIGKLSDTPPLHLLFAVETILGTMDPGEDFAEPAAISPVVAPVIAGVALASDATGGQPSSVAEAQDKAHSATVPGLEPQAEEEDTSNGDQDHDAEISPVATSVPAPVTMTETDPRDPATAWNESDVVAAGFESGEDAAQAASDTFVEAAAVETDDRETKASVKKVEDIATTAEPQTLSLEAPFEIADDIPVSGPESAGNGAQRELDDKTEEASAAQAEWISDETTETPDAEANASEVAADLVAADAVAPADQTAAASADDSTSDRQDIFHLSEEHAVTATSAEIDTNEAEATEAEDGVEPSDDAIQAAATNNPEVAEETSIEKTGMPMGFVPDHEESADPTEDAAIAEQVVGENDTRPVGADEADPAVGDVELIELPAEMVSEFSATTPEQVAAMDASDDSIRDPATVALESAETNETDRTDLDAMTAVPEHAGTTDAFESTVISQPSAWVETDLNEAATARDGADSGDEAQADEAEAEATPLPLLDPSSAFPNKVGESAPIVARERDTADALGEMEPVVQTDVTQTEDVVSDDDTDAVTSAFSHDAVQESTDVVPDEASELNGGTGTEIAESETSTSETEEQDNALIKGGNTPELEAATDALDQAAITEFEADTLEETVTTDAIAADATASGDETPQEPAGARPGDGYEINAVDETETAAANADTNNTDRQEDVPTDNGNVSGTEAETSVAVVEPPAADEARERLDQAAIAAFEDDSRQVEDASAADAVDAVAPMFEDEQPQISASAQQDDASKTDAADEIESHLEESDTIEARHQENAWTENDDLPATETATQEADFSEFDQQTNTLTENGDLPVAGTEVQEAEASEAERQENAVTETADAAFDAVNVIDTAASATDASTAEPPEDTEADSEQLREAKSAITANFDSLSESKAIVTGLEVEETEAGDLPDVLPAPAFSFNPAGRSVRFVWKIDAGGRFGAVSSEFAGAVGPRSADILDRTFEELAALYGLDPEGTIGDLLKKRDTWSGKTILWPVDNEPLRVPVDLAALPTYTRLREFDGFRGFGIVRVADAVADLSPRPDFAAVQDGVDVIATMGESDPTDKAAASASMPERDAFAGATGVDAVLPAPGVSEETDDSGRLEDTTDGEGPAAVDSTRAADIADSDGISAAEDRLTAQSADAGSQDDDEQDGDAHEKTDQAEAEQGRHETDRDDTMIGTETPEDDLYADPFRGERPALRVVTPFGRRNSDKVVALESVRPQSRDTLTRGEEAAFREIARQIAEKVAAGEATTQPPELLLPEMPPSEAVARPPEEAKAVSGNTSDAPPVLDLVELPDETEAADDIPVFAEEPDDMEGADETPSAPRQDSLGSAILDTLPVALLVHAGDTLYHANAEFLKLTGYASLDALRAEGGLDALFVGEDDGLDAVPGGTLMLISNSGRLIPVTARLQSVRYEDKSALLMALSTVQPVVAETEALPVVPAIDHDALKLEIDELHSILETATDGIVILGAEGEIRSLNRSASALFNYDDAETRGKPFAMLFAHESQKAVLDYVSGLVGHGVASVLNDGREVIGREASGGFIPLFMTMGRLPSSNGHCAVIRDITQWKRTEDELRSAKRAAETANAHKTEFLARVSHEIRTPLNAIIGFSDMMASEHFGPIGNPRYVEYAHDIGRSGRHVLDIVNDLLDISKIEAGEMELEFTAVELNETVAEAVSLVQPQANSQRVIIRTSLSGAVPQIVADTRSIKQIALNILSNAIRFTPSGGQIVVSTAYEPSGSVILRIRDTGIGMTRGELEQAMKPFRQVTTGTRKRGDGTGLGLPLTKAMTEANRALFSINSAPNEGTLVEIAFPSQRVLAD